MNVQQPQLSPEFFAEMQGKALEAFSVLADMNHRVLQGLVGLSASTAKEGLRTYAELQSATVEAARTPQAPVGPDAFEALRHNPFAWYQKGLLASSRAPRSPSTSWRPTPRSSPASPSASRLRPSRPARRSRRR